MSVIEIITEEQDRDAECFASHFTKRARIFITSLSRFHQRIKMHHIMCMRHHRKCMIYFSWNSLLKSYNVTRISIKEKKTWNSVHAFLVHTRAAHSRCCVLIWCYDCVFFYFWRSPLTRRFQNWWIKDWIGAGLFIWFI